MPSTPRVPEIQRQAREAARETAREAAREAAGSYIRYSATGRGE
jgi:hypothetical protein